MAVVGERLDAAERAQRTAVYGQRLYFADYRTFLGNMVWRPTATLHYVALLTLPLMVMALSGFVAESKQLFAQCGAKRFLREKGQHILFAFAAYILFGIIYGLLVNDVSLFMPYLGWDETLETLGGIPRGGWTLVTSIGAILSGYIVVQRYRKEWHEIPTSERLLDLFTILVFAEHLIFFKFGDRYLLPLLPFVIITVGRYARTMLNRYAVLAFSACLVMILLSAIWTRGTLEQSEASWRAAELVRTAGVERCLIFCTYEWNSYYGITNDYISDIGQSLVKDFKDFWHRFLPGRKRHAEFLVATSPTKLDGKIVYEIPYRDMFFRKKQLYVVHKLGS
jgi:hypothetical protein